MQSFGKQQLLCCVQKRPTHTWQAIDCAEVTKQLFIAPCWHDNGFLKVNSFTNSSLRQHDHSIVIHIFGWYAAYLVVMLWQLNVPTLTKALTDCDSVLLYLRRNTSSEA